MNTFTVRIELVNATDHDYESLPPLMERQGFSFDRVLKKEKEKGVQYVLTKDVTMEAALNLARDAAKETHKQFFIFITEMGTGKGAGATG